MLGIDYWNVRKIRRGNLLVVQPERTRELVRLNRARTEFGEQKNRVSEPDIIISTDRALFFFEAKLTSGNKKPPSNWAKSTRYQTGGGDWFSKVFRSDYNQLQRSIMS